MYRYLPSRHAVSLLLRPHRFPASAYKGGQQVQQTAPVPPSESLSLSLFSLSAASNWEPAEPRRVTNLGAKEN